MSSTPWERKLQAWERERERVTALKAAQREWCLERVATSMKVGHRDAEAARLAHDEDFQVTQCKILETERRRMTRGDRDVLSAQEGGASSKGRKGVRVGMGYSKVKNYDAFDTESKLIVSRLQ